MTETLEYQAPGMALGGNEGGAWGRLRRALGSIVGAVIGLAMVLLIFGLWQPRLFLRLSNLDSIFLYNNYIIVAAIGATFVIITGGIDLSMGSTIAFASVACAMAVKGVEFPKFDWTQSLLIAGGCALLVGLCAAGYLLQRGGGRLRAAALSIVAAAVGGTLCALLWEMIAGRTTAPMPGAVAIIVGICAGGVVGLINGALITTLSLPPFIVTLGTLEAVRGLTLTITDASGVSSLPPTMLQSLHWSRFWGHPPNDWIAIGTVVVAVPLLHFSVLGRYTYAIGSNERTARLCGVRVGWWKVVCYVIAGLCSGLAGVMMTSLLAAGEPTEFVGLELTIIAAVVIGGTSLFGGEGTIIGSVIGVLMLGSLHTGCNLAGVRPYEQRIFIGGMIILAAALDRFRHLMR